MQDVKPESPLVLEEILIRWHWRVTYKDDSVCVMDNPRDPKCRPVCIPQKPDANGNVDLEIMRKILFDVGLVDSFNYLPLRAAVLGEASAGQPPEIKRT